MNTSLLCIVLALSGSWSDAPSDIRNSVGPTPDIFHRAEPAGLFDEITSDSFRGSAVPENFSDSEVHWNLSDLDWNTIASERGGSLPRQKSGSLASTDQSNPPFQSLLRAQRDYIVRGQSPNYMLADVARPDAVPTPRTFATPAPSTPVYVPQPTQQPYEEQPIGETPPVFAQPTPSPYMTAPPPGAIPGASTWGANGPQPYRLGYNLWTDAGWLPKEQISLGGKGLEVFEFNLGLNHTIPTWWSPWLFSLQHEFGYRAWEGPAAVDLPGDAFRFGWDMRLETPLNSQYAPFAISLAFNPSINTDFAHTLTRNAYNFDGRGILFFQADPRLLLAVGAGFWDRVNDRVIPYAGFVWLPDDRWEFRIMWPQSRIQYYLGNHWGEDMWLYASGEYHVESYQIGTTASPTGKDQIELEDYRIMLGLRKSNPIASGFIEGGWVFGRKTDLRFSPGSDFSISSGAIMRVGLRF